MAPSSEDNGLKKLFEEQYAGYFEPDTMLLALRNRLHERGFPGVKLDYPGDLANLKGDVAEAARCIIPTLQMRFNEDLAASLL